MSYFGYTDNCHHYRNEWESLLQYVKNDWPCCQRKHLGDLAHHIEAKALYVFTMSRHLIEATEKLANSQNGEGEKWDTIFVEASLLLFPMLELVGQARLGSDSTSTDFSSGIDWLLNPQICPRSNRKKVQLKNDNDRINTLGNFMDNLPSGPKIRELFHIRNYFTHGLKNQRDSNFDIGSVQTSMNYEMPCAIAKQSRKALLMYWDQLTSTNSNISQNWVTRLAEADIYPFGIMGASTYEKGLIDPDIVYWIVDQRP